MTDLLNQPYAISLVKLTKIVGLLRTDFFEIAAACEPLCTFLRFRDLANHAKIVTNAVKMKFFAGWISLALKARPCLHTS
jgi:hypothetical protein